jgi:gamma-glutamyltranspeptidase/glutathione hydrolase
VDAAIACNAAMGLMEPMSNGLGGDLYAIVWEAKTQKLYGLNASGRAPLKATREFFASKGLKAIPESGPLSWNVPGCVDGWFTLHGKFGSVPMAKILQPSIDYAEKGYPVPEVIGRYYQASRRYARDEDFAKIYMPNGKLPATGTLFKNPALGRAFRLLAEKGRDGYYNGPIAESLIALSDRKGGLFQKADFEKTRASWVEPVSTNYRGYDVWEIPPPGQGIATLQMLNTLEKYDLKKMGPNSADYWHLLIESKKLAFADRAKYYTDPDFEKVPVKELISKEYAASRNKLISMDKAMTDVAAGDAKIGKADTIFLTVVDNDRNCVSLIQSNYMGFGSGLFCSDFGFSIQNRGTLFSLDPNHANKLEPGKRPFHTIIPALVTKNNKPVFCFGVMGGDMQPQGHVEVLVNIIDFGMNVQAAGESPRIEHVGSATPTGKPGDANGGTCQVEVGIPDEVVAELTRRGHKINRVKTNSGGYQGIWIDWENDILQGASESRKDGAAVGY